jgi:hypothetical protein
METGGRVMLAPWMIWDLERERERKEREAEVGRGLWLPVPPPPADEIFRDDEPLAV